MTDICHSHTCKVLLTDVVPAVGCIPFLYVIMSNVPAMRAIEKNKSTGNANVLVYPMMVTVSNSFLMYGLFLKNYYIYTPNCVGILFAL